MKLEDMTKEELRSLDSSKLIELAHNHDIDTTTMGYDTKMLCSIIISRPLAYIFADLEQRRLELQQSRTSSKPEQSHSS